MDMSPELKAVLQLQQNPSMDEFKEAVRNSSIAVKNEYLRFITAPSQHRRFVEEERRRHQQEINEAQTERRHQQEINANRAANRLSRWAILIAVAAFLVTVLAWLFPREPQGIGHKESDRQQKAVPALLQSTNATALPLTNAMTTNQLPHKQQLIQ